MDLHEDNGGCLQTPFYDVDTYLRLADTVASLNESECHSDFFATREHIVGRLWEAASDPAAPHNHRLINSLPLFVYVHLELGDSVSRKN